MNILAWFEGQIATLLFDVARHVITQKDVNAMLVNVVKNYENKIKAEMAALPPQHPATPNLSPPKLQNQYEQRYATMEINANRLSIANTLAKRILSNKARYSSIESQTGVPWWFIGILHYRESNCDFETYLGNGQSLARVTTLVPKGRGPFTSFEAGAVDALKLEGFTRIIDWSIGSALHLFEAYNGMGYHNKGLPSPYVWGGCNWYVRGKYIADGVFSAGTVDTQLGCAVILRCMEKLDPSIHLEYGASIQA